ncbi:MAG: alpha-mannosidase, partial [Verrucomicrobiota bacterium]
MSREDIGRVDFLYLKKLRKRVEEIGKNISRSKVSITDIALAETMDHLTPEQARGLKFRTVRPGRRWGRIWGTGWFRLRIVVPDEFDGKELFLIFDNGGECIIFDGSNMLGSLDRHHREQPIIRKARAGEKLELFIEAGANGPFGNFRGRTAGVPELAAVNRDVWDCYHDLKALLELLEVLDQNDTRAARIRFEMNKAVDLFDYSASDDRALAASARKVRRGVAGLLSRPANASAQTVACVGHAHIDVAWKWPLRETVRKCGRTFSNVLAYMDRYPDFIFCQSQPQLYEYTKKKYPDLYSRICRQVKAGRWVPVGGMWVEADCNLISGESMVRQLLFGTRFFEKEFGHRCRCLWLPDVFGYSAALPQILKRSGIDYFMTQKMSWNQFTRFPYHSFWWEGIDGSRVLTHFPPVDTYNGCLSAEELKNAESRYMEKDRSSIQLLPLGHGDGGGGPTMEMMERLKRYGDIEGLPKARPMAPNDFFRTLEKESDSFKKWVGELYLELHRGTLTTQAANKKNNRKSELLLRDTELISSVNCVAGESYPAKRLNAAWKTLLLNQFHDIIPGSSIREVYEDSDSDYERILSETEKIHSEAIVKFARGVDSKGDGRAVFVCNTLGWEREDVVSVKIRDLRRDRDYSAEFP